MATTTARLSRRRGAIPYWLVGATVAASIIAVLPIVGALFSGGSPSEAPRTAFATASAGNYMVLAMATPADDADIIYVAPAADPANAIEVARVPRLAGYVSRGSVSPDGKLLALSTADGGTPARPVASLIILNLETGALTRAAVAVDSLQAPVWAGDSRSVAITRTAEGDSGPADVSVTLVPVDRSGEVEVALFLGVLGAYPVAFDPQGQLVTVVIDARGSTAYRNRDEVARLAAGLTRDWSLSPDGSALAFIEAELSGGLRYLPRLVSLSGGAAAQSLSADGQALGTAWNPAAGTPAFGNEPGSGGAAAQSFAGFDLPLAFAADGSALVVEHWTGSSFAAPGDRTFEVDHLGQRTSLTGYQEFYGWAAR
jgi:dipeptidyl aminopeptidase/acylaminoacyl peptidase